MRRCLKYLPSRMSAAMKLNVAAVLTMGITVISLCFQTKASEWTAMNVGRPGACSASLSNGRVLITGGEGSQGIMNRVDIMGPDGSLKSAASMLSGHSDHMCVTLDGGRVLVGGGQLSGGGSSSSAEVYDPKTDEWSLAGPMITPRSGATATLLKSSRVLIAGGSNSGTDLSSVEIFNAVDNIF